MIPVEIVEFFSKEGGHSLIIKGEPGSGKTTLALEILDNFRDKKKVLYMSTRVKDEVLLNQFPWAKDTIIKEKIKKNVGKIDRRHLNMLEGLIEEGFVKEIVEIDDDEAILEVGELLPEMERIYDFSEENFGEAMVCIDSIDGLSEKYGIPPERILYTIQKDLVETGAADVIFVMEETSTKGIDYLGDGIVTLYHEPERKFWKRMMFIKKLRGAEIKRPTYLYSLTGGRFHAIKYEPFSMDKIIPESPDLIKFFEKYRNFQAVNVVVDDDFPRELVEMTIITLAKIAEGTTLILPPVFYPGETLKRHSGEIASRIRIIGFGNERREIYLEGSDMLMELSNDVVSYHGGEKATVVLGVDAISNIYGDLKDLPSLIKNLKMKFNVWLLTPSHLRIGGGVDSEIKLTSIGDIPIIIGDMAYGISRIREDQLELVPLL